VILFAAGYFLMAQADANNFSVQALTHTDMLYFTVTVFTTVGFGDITATSQTVRLLVTAHMILDLIVLGVVVRVFIGAIGIARHEPAEPEAEPS
jgi:voltage-gated potassium channel